MSGYLFPHRTFQNPPSFRRFHLPRARRSSVVLLDKVGFEEILDNSLASPIHGRALLRERSSWSTLLLCDWHLPNKWGVVLSCPLDLTLSSANAGWAMELDGEQIDEMQRHVTHEFWSTQGTREVLAAEEVSNLLRLQNHHLFSSHC